jgi:PD-(D/E)XK nuclease superfamily
MAAENDRGVRDRTFAEEIATLKRSPLFSLSLGSKEHFHSNFLSWIGTVYPQQTGRLLARFLQHQSGDCSLAAEPDREKQNIDVWFKFKNGDELILENKVKSIATKGQLEDYTDEQLARRGGQKNFLLLSLTRPHFVKGDAFPIGNTTWHFLDYAGLAALMSNLIGTISESYHREILRDYVQFSMILDRIGKCADINFEVDTFSFNRGRIVELLKSVRMDDVYLKQKFAIIAEELAQRLEEGFPDKIKRDNWKSAKKRRNDTAGTILVNPDMTRAQGVVDMKCVIRPGLCRGVQIQENKYKKLVEGTHAKHIAERLKSDGLWFDFPPSFNPKTTYPLHGNGFNHYGKEFY